MLKRTITYNDLDGNPVTEDFYFHYSTAEATELRAVLGDDIRSRVQKLIDSNKPKEIIAIFKEMIADSVGKRSANGKSFIKTVEYRDEFMGSDAYSEMVLWMLGDMSNMTAFVNGIFPANMQERVAQLAAEREAQGKTTVELPQETFPKPNLTAVQSPILPEQRSPLGVEKRLVDYTSAEIMQMTPEEFAALKARG